MEFYRWEIYLHGARFFEGTDPSKAEQFFEQALQAARNEVGARSAAVGLVLESFSTFLRKLERPVEAERYESEVRIILCGYAQARSYFQAS